MLDEKFVYICPLITLIFAGQYTIATLRGETKPNRVTWLLWSVAPLIAFAAEIADGVGIRSIMTFLVGFGPLVILIASFVNPKAFWKTTRFDLFCGALAVASLIAWLVTSSGDVAIALSIATDALAALPTIVKAYRHPQTESASAYIGGATNGLITLLTLDHWTFSLWGFPLYIFTVMGGLGVMILIRQRASAVQTPAAASA